MPRGGGMGKADNAALAPPPAESPAKAGGSSQRMPQAKEPGPPLDEQVPLLALFRYATLGDYVLLVVGILSGASMGECASLILFSFRTEEARTRARPSGRQADSMSALAGAVRPVNMVFFGA